MLLRARSLVTTLVAAATAAACSGQTSESTKPADVVAVPLTNASMQQMAYQQVDDITPPWSLTASDGSGLVLARVEAKAVFEGPLAFTELHLYFHNPEDRRREGTFQITLPSGAAVSRFAMESDGQWMEAEVVEKQLARRAYDDFLHRTPGSGAAREGRRQPVHREGVPDRGERRQAHRDLLQPGAAGHAVRAAAARAAARSGSVDVALQALGRRRHAHRRRRCSQRDWQPDRDFVSTARRRAAAVGATGHWSRRRSPVGGATRRRPPSAARR